MPSVVSAYSMSARAAGPDYSYFDTVVNQHLLEAGVLDIERGTVIGLVVKRRPYLCLGIISRRLAAA